MDIDNVKRLVQAHLTDGLVVIVGSGVSCAEGLPGMGTLADHLQKEVPARIEGNAVENWTRIAEQLAKGEGLETALMNCPPEPQVEALVLEHTAQLILAREKQVIESVVAGDHVLPFSRLLKHLVKPLSGIPVVTTNYDRLIEVAVEHAGLALNTLFFGHHVAALDPKASFRSICTDLRKVAGKYRLMPVPHVTVLKPHGSLDWFKINDPVKSPHDLSSPRLIITPGWGKFRGGYNRPFDTHREHANSYIDKAARFLVLGYGFNDDHLQTHLEPRIKKGTPTILVTRTLSATASALINASGAMTALSADGDKDGTRVTTKDSDSFIAGPSLWDLNGLVKEALEP